MSAAIAISRGFRRARVVAAFALGTGVLVAGCGGPSSAPTTPKAGPTAAPEPAPRVVNIAPFEMDATEVTVEAYQFCIEDKACEVPVRHEARDPARSACNYGRPLNERHPVNCVTWTQADSYCRYLGKRLPTEDEWEWAARNGSSATSYPWGDATPTRERAWFGLAHGEGGTKPAGEQVGGDNSAGIHDLMGNVAEWTSSAGADAEHRAVRGGGAWDGELPPASRRALGRYVGQSEHSPNIGFRCVRSAGS